MNCGVIDAKSINPKIGKSSAKLTEIREKSLCLDVGQAFYLESLTDKELMVIKVSMSREGKNRGKKFSIFKHEGKYLVKRVA